MNFRKPTPTVSPLPLSEFPTALKECFGSLRIVEMKGTNKHEFDLSSLECSICGFLADNSSELESHILEKHSTKEEMVMWNKYECISNRIHEMVKGALAKQTASGALKMRFADSRRLGLTMPVDCSVAKYFRLEHLIIRLTDRCFQKTLYWHKFEMMNHLNTKVVVYVDFQNQIHEDKKVQELKVLKRMYKWQKLGERLIHEEYPLCSASVKKCIAEMLEIPETLKATVVAIKKRPIWEDKKANNFLYLKSRRPEKEEEKENDPSG